MADRVASAKATVTCCRAGADHLRELVVPELQERVHLVHHGVDVGLPPAPQRDRTAGAVPPPLIVSIGRLVDKKGYGDLLTACRLLKEPAWPSAWRSTATALCTTG